MRNKANEKLPVPLGWVMSSAGEPSTDPLDLIERKGFLTSLGGTPEGASHKGYGLAAMARILSAGLAGAPMLLRPEEASQPPMGSLAHFFFAMDPGLFRDADAFRNFTLLELPHSAVAGERDYAVTIVRNFVYTWISIAMVY